MDDTRIFIDKLNEALAKGDTAFVMAHTADDVNINFVGGEVVDGKEAAQVMLEQVYGGGKTQRIVSRVVTAGNVRT